VEIQADLMITRPSFTGIHETLPNSGGNVPHEGGGSLPPYGEDLFQRIVDINFGGGDKGGVFVAGDVCCYFRTATVPELTLVQPWKGLGSLLFSDGGGHAGCSYALVNGRPTFLMCGDGTNGGSSFGGLITISHDGTNWDTSFFNTDRDFDYISDIVWDPRDGGAFYANPSRGVLMSRTGTSWTFLPDDNFYSHCVRGVGDGLIGYDPDTGLTIHPGDIPLEALRYCNCTAFTGGIWLAGGNAPDSVSARAGIASSIDGGKTWQLVSYGTLGMNADYSITCIIGGPMGDF
jgi:hypothetical protein